MRTAIFLLIGVILSGSTIGVAAVENDCPTDALAALNTIFSGQMTILDLEGRTQANQRVRETHRVTSCYEYTAKIQYQDNDGKITREQEFSGTWDGNGKQFKIFGANIKGTFRILKANTYFVNFDTRFPTGPASCDELISVTNQGKALYRTLHCFSGGTGGPALGTRAVQGLRQ